MKFWFDVCRTLLFELLCLLAVCLVRENVIMVMGSEGAVRECCEPVSPTPPAYPTSEVPVDYLASTDIVQPGRSW